MPTVLQMTRVLRIPPIVSIAANVSLRTYRDESDAARWLELRVCAFQAEQPSARPWSVAEFRREFLDKPWWRPEAMWFVEASVTVGSITLARRADGKPAMNWLMVDPAYRRRGIGRMLIATLESTVWNEGGRQVWLETHQGWEHAVTLYRSLGYIPDNPA